MNMTPNSTSDSRARKQGRNALTDAVTALPKALAPAVFRSLNRAVKPAVRAGLFAPPLIGVGTVLLTTTGRQTGKPREVPVAAVRIGSTVFVSTVRSASKWMSNLEAQPKAEVALSGKARRGVASFAQTGPLRVATVKLVD